MPMFLIVCNFNGKSVNSLFLSQSQMMKYCYRVSGLLGLGPIFRLALFFLMPEEHYFIDKCVYTKAPNVEAVNREISV